MRDVSIVDISDPNNIQELLTDVGDDRLREDEADVLKNNDDDDDDDDDDNDDDEEEELGLIPRLLFGTFSTLTILVPLVSTHIALDIIVHQQYAQDFDAVEIAARAATAALGTRMTRYFAEFGSSGFPYYLNSSSTRSASVTVCNVFCFLGPWCCNDQGEQRGLILCCHGNPQEVLLISETGTRYWNVIDFLCC